MTKPNSKHQVYKLSDLILAVTSCSKNSREAAAAVSDLLESGRVRLEKPKLNNTAVTSVEQVLGHSRAL